MKTAAAELIVLDASVAAKWILPPRSETFVDQAMGLLDQYEQGRVRIIVPDLFWTEIASILWKSARLGRISADDAHRGVRELTEHAFPTQPARPLLEDALVIAMVYQRSVYDCLYIAVARARGAAFVTADERLANTLASRYSIRWLGSFD